ncbi:MAG TPA: hypothetical protein VFJ00_03190 [Candidatus Limnocylindria bacterium]|nr:hypothetical protein [Candidatus Limnocylindria bacterium]
MAILATLFGLVGRFTGKLLTMSLGWASLLLFGRVPKEKEIFLAAITFGSVIWVVLIIGVALPAAGVFLLSFLPIPDWVDENLVRLAMLAAVLVLPPVLSLATLKLLRAEDRPKGIRGILLHLARGYPLAAGLALLLVFLGIIGLWRKVGSLARRWTDTHIPIVVKPGGYEQLAADLDTAISDAGIDIEARDAPAVMVVPGKLLATVAGTSVRGLLPDRLVRLVGKDVEVLIYPSDVAISGKAVTTSRVQAALASRLTTAQAWLTMTAEGQAIEDQLGEVAERRPDGAERSKALESIDHHLSTEELAYDEWEVLYRQRLQVERDLLAGRRPGEEMPAASGSASAASATSGALGWLRRDPIGTAFAVGGLVLVGLNAALLLLERRGTAPRR